MEEQGVKEVVEKAPEIMKKVRYIEEKEIMQKFLYEVGHDTGMITYGEAEVRRLLQSGAVRLLMMSESLGSGSCHRKMQRMRLSKNSTPSKARKLLTFEQGLTGKPCAKCKAPIFTIVDKKDVIDDLAELAELSNTDVEVISTETEEGQMLKNAFGGIAAMLRFKMQG